MKRQLIIAILFVSSFVIAIAFAQAAGPNNTATSSVNINTPLVAQHSATNISVLSWAKTPQGVDWFSGIALALTGFMGALVTIFFLIGGVVPNTAGQVEIDYYKVQLKFYEDKLKEAVTSEPCDTAKAGQLVTIVDNLRNSLNSERQHQFTSAALIYVIIGAFFAAFLAQDILQALVIGAGWTGYIGSLGLKQDANERSSRKNDVIDDLVKQSKDDGETLVKTDALSKDKTVEEHEKTKKKSKIREDLQHKAKMVRAL
jgi:hypothetical protein